MFHRITVCLVAAALFAPFTAEAQETTFSSLTRMKMENLWFTNTGNVAGMYLDQIDMYSDTHFYFNQERGNFKRTQAGNMDSKFGFHAEGGGINQRVGGIYLWGKFDYTRNKVREARFNSNLVDPFRGSSFYIADPNLSDWLKHRYDIQFQVSTKKLFDVMVLGLDAAYKSDMASKQVDARGNFFIGEFQLKPGIVLSFQKHALGLNFEYIKRHESSKPNLSVSMTQLAIAEMQFPGYFIRNEMGLINGGPDTERDYRSHSLGGGTQYNYKGDAFKLLVSGNYALAVETTFTERVAGSVYENNKQEGSNIFTSYNGKVNAIYDFFSSALFFNAEYRHRDIETLGITQEYDSSEDVQRWITTNRARRGNVSSNNLEASLEWMLKKDNSYTWLAGIEGRHEKLLTEYYIPESTEKENSVYVDIYVKKNFVFNDVHSLELRLKGGLKNVIDKSHDYQPYYPDNIFYTEFTLMDYAYLSTGYLKGGMDISYTFTGFPRNGAIYATAAVDYVKPRKATPDTTFKNRTLCNFKLGILF